MAVRRGESHLREQQRGHGKDGHGIGQLIERAGKITLTQSLTDRPRADMVAQTHLRSWGPDQKTEVIDSTKEDFYYFCV